MCQSIIRDTVPLLQRHHASGGSVSGNDRICLGIHRLAAASGGEYQPDGEMQSGKRDAGEPEKPSPIGGSDARAVSDDHPVDVTHVPVQRHMAVFRPTFPDDESIRGDIAGRSSTAHRRIGGRARVQPIPSSCSSDRSEDS
jgi:hypothetical protein